MKESQYSVVIKFDLHSPAVKLEIWRNLKNSNEPCFARATMSHLPTNVCWEIIYEKKRDKSIIGNTKCNQNTQHKPVCLHILSHDLQKKKKRQVGKIALLFIFTALAKKDM